MGLIQEGPSSHYILPLHCYHCRLHDCDRHTSSSFLMRARNIPTYIITPAPAPALGIGIGFWGPSAIGTGFDRSSSDAERTFSGLPTNFSFLLDVWNTGCRFVSVLAIKKNLYPTHTPSLSIMMGVQYIRQFHKWFFRTSLFLTKKYHNLSGTFLPGTLLPSFTPSLLPLRAFFHYHFSSMHISL